MKCVAKGRLASCAPSFGAMLRPQCTSWQPLFSVRASALIVNESIDARRNRILALTGKSFHTASIFARDGTPFTARAPHGAVRTQLCRRMATDAPQPHDKRTPKPVAVFAKEKADTSWKEDMTAEGLVQSVHKMRQNKGTIDRDLLAAATAACCYTIGPRQELVSMLAKLRKQTFPAYSQAMYCLVRLKAPREALVLFERMQEEGLKPSLDTYGKAIHAASASSNIDLCLELLEQLKLKKYTPSAAILTSIIKGCFRTGRPEVAQRMWEDLCSTQGNVVDVKAFNTIIHGYAYIGQLDRAFELLREMRAMNVPRNEDTYSFFMRCIIITNRKAGENTAKTRELLTRLLTEMVDDGCTISPRAYLSLMELMCLEGQVDGALQLFQELKDRQIKLHSLMYCALMEALCRAGRKSQADALMLELKQSGLNIPTEASLPFLRFECAMGRSQHAHEMLGTLLTEGITPTVKLFHIVINGFMRENNMPAALKVFEQMEAVGVKPDFLITKTILRAVVSIRGVEAAIQFKDEMRMKGVQFDASIPSLIIEGYGKRGEPDKAVEVLETLQAKEQLAPIEHNFAALIRSFGANGQLEKAAEVMRRMEEGWVSEDGKCIVRPIKASYLSQYSLLSSCQMAGVNSATAERILKAASAHGEEYLAGPAFDILIKTAAAREPAAVLPYLNDMRARRLKPAALSWYFGMREHMKQKNVKAALAFWAEMDRSQGINVLLHLPPYLVVANWPMIVEWRALLNSIIVEASPQEGEEVLRWMKDNELADQQSYG